MTRLHGGSCVVALAGPWPLLGPWEGPCSKPPAKYSHPQLAVHHEDDEHDSIDDDDHAKREDDGN